LRKSQGWIIESFRPDFQPMYSLSRVLARVQYADKESAIKEEKEYASFLCSSLENRTRELWQEVNDITSNSELSLMLVIDQFEEVYATPQDLQHRFVNLLLEAVKNNPSLKIVFSIRTDFLDHIINYPPFKEISLQQGSPVFLGDMTTEEMRSAIELVDRNTQEILVELEEGLTDRILSDVQEEPGRLPLLQFSLTQLWKSLDGKRLTLRQYEEIGGVKKALANHANEIYRTLNAEDKKRIQCIFLKLVRPGEKFSDETNEDLDGSTVHDMIIPERFFIKDQRKPATRSELGEENWALAARLTGGTSGYKGRLPLLVTGQNEKTGEPTVEIVHEALIREWGLLVSWINDFRDDLIKEDELKKRTEAWKNNNEKSGYLLQGKLLKDAKSYARHLVEESSSISLSTDILSFIRASSVHKWRQLLLFLILPTFITIFASLSVLRLVEIGQLWSVVDAGDSKRNSLPRNKALEKLIQLGENLGDRSFADHDLSRVNLKGANLKGSNFSGANLNGADLEGADLRDAIFREADLGSVNLRSANLTRANLEDAYLFKADLQKANLNSSILTQADLGKSKLNNSNFEGAKLSGANLSYAEIKQAQFMRSDLSQTNLGSADLTETDLNKANLEDAYLGNAIFHRTSMYEANLSGVMNFSTQQLQSVLPFSTPTQKSSLPTLVSQEWLSVQVTSTDGWQGDKICVESGQTLKILAYGKWSNGLYSRTDGVSSRPFSSADGRPTDDKEDERQTWIAPYANLSSLMGKINNKYFVIGKSYEKQFSQGGCISLTINDSDVLKDNQGEISIIVKLTR
jgi:uncharacterized protein YjbI with pentapeptide repeats